MTAADPLFSAPEIDAIFSRETHVRYLLAFEAALARALARIGALSSDAARAIGEACHVDLYDIPTLYAEAARASTVVVPLVRHRRARGWRRSRFRAFWRNQPGCDRYSFCSTSTRRSRLAGCTSRRAGRFLCHAGRAASRDADGGPHAAATGAANHLWFESRALVGASHAPAAPAASGSRGGARVAVRWRGGNARGVRTQRSTHHGAARGRTRPRRARSALARRARPDRCTRRRARHHRRRDGEDRGRYRLACSD